jgi:Ca-activated chloride channel family protein
VQGLKQLPRTIWTRLRWLPTFLRTVILVLIVIALARPQYGFSRESVETLGVDIILAVDLSDTMQANDFQPNRLAVAKRAMQEFVAERPSDNFAIVGFGEIAALLCPLTPEFDIVTQFIDRLDFQVLGSATAMGDAILLACDQFEKSEAVSRVLILLTDGRNTAGRIEPLKAAEVAAALGVNIYTIGIGSNNRQRSWFNLNMSAEFDPETLKGISDKTNGQYFHASDSEKFNQIFDEIDSMERTRRERVVNREYDEKMEWFIWPALVLLCLELLLVKTRLRSLP